MNHRYASGSHDSSAAMRRASIPVHGRILAARYRLEECIARGAMGELWRAHHLPLDISVAVKFVAPSHPLPDELEARLVREALATAKLRSPNIVTVHDHGVEEGMPYLVMELLEGEDLAARLDRVGQLSLGETAAVIGQAARGLRCAHEAGIVHRDIKPSNLFLARFGDEETVKLVDFGIAKDTGETGYDGDLTSSEHLLGSPSYMSREQARGETVTPRSDQWSLAAVTYRALTGVAPFLGADLAHVLANVNDCRFRPARELAPELPEAIDGLFSKAFAMQPAARFANVMEMAQYLTALANASPPSLPGGSFPPPIRSTLTDLRKHVPGSPRTHLESSAGAAAETLFDPPTMPFDRR